MKKNTGQKNENWARKLNQLAQLRLDVVDDQKRLQELYEQRDKILMPPLIGKVQQQPGDRVASLAVKIADLETQIEEGVLKAVALEFEVRSFLDTVDDPLIRRIIKLRCIECLDWYAVAERIGSKHTATSVRLRYQRYLKQPG